MKKLIKTVIKWGPLLYPVVKKIMNDKKKKEAYTRGRTAR
ncbi:MULTISPECIES: hypothetical protein [unclassified Sporosarcina]|nr:MULTISPECIES: hypothetical protein [unclassified Sporosarcina]GKV63899.1 hypothetical protein NCCP2331_00520 [Sporosarcina sp. NCCP-2331]GLB54679.1 hypothetical protein NCCP2378_04640 [Sporosarcina sp. NCCP-2378]